MRSTDDNIKRLSGRAGGPCRRLRGLGTIALAMWAGLAGAALPLTDQPQGATSSLAPNILVAIDDSGSMDFETLFPTNNGLLNWSDAGNVFATGSNDNGIDYVQNGSVSYAYLFPNGYNSCIATGNCQSRDRRVYSVYGAIPPIPGTAFARSSDYNSAYFNPAAHYSPWVGKPAAVPSAAYYDPQIHSATLDLTGPRESNDSGEQFDLRAGMVIPAGTRYYHAGGISTVTKNYYCVLRFFSYAFDAYVPSAAEIAAGQCFRARYSLESYNNVTQTSPGFYADDAPHSGAVAETIGISYFPATFYLRPDTALPAGFGWKPSAPTVPGFSPLGDPLTGYEIKPTNFVSDAAYSAAIQNFANWFTYYRKRSLAIRGGVTAAFDRIGKVRVGACTINSATNNATGISNTNLVMRTLGDIGTPDADRQSFYDTVYGFDFSLARATPNRGALYYLGRQFETNPDIIQSACQRNYALLFTDGFNAATLPVPAALDVGNADKDLADPRYPHSPVPDDYTATIADTAMRFYKKLVPPSAVDTSGVLPLPPGCPDDPSADCVTRPHMTTFGITLGQGGYIFGNPRFKEQNADPFASTPPPPWYIRSFSNNGRVPPGDLSPLSNLADWGPEQIDDLWHATINSRGALLNAGSPEALATKFQDVLNQILGRGEAITNATGNGQQLVDGATVYQTSYRTSHWSGDLIAYDARSGSTAPDARKWSAAAQLDDDSSRQIITARRSDTSASSAAVTATSFTVNGLNGAGYDALTPDAIAYLRGSRAKEQNANVLDAVTGRVFRNRGDTVLGDIINSPPVYVGPPAPLRYAGGIADTLYPRANAPETGHPYYAANDPDSFAVARADRTPMVYVGANDGMLHGFDADDGRERFAFVPNAVLGNLAGSGNLTDPDYHHRGYVDGPITVGPAFFDNAWHTMLVGGLRTGGRTQYALDVTDPDTLAQAESHPERIVRWEFRDPDLGNTYSKASIVRLHTDPGRWAAVFANGYNSDNARDALYVVDISTGALIRKFTNLPDDDGRTPLGGNGLASPVAADVDGDQVVDYLYAGDLDGRVYRFDLTAASPSAWSVRPIFRAMRNASPQPITAGLDVAAHPNGAGYGVMIYFGTGQDIVPLTDDNAQTPNSFYGIWDPNVVSYTATDDKPPPSATAGWSVQASELVHQSVAEAGNSGIAELSLRSVTDHPVSYIRATNQGPVFDRRGWAIDFMPGSNEAVIAAPAVERTTVEFASVVLDRTTCSLTSSGFYTAVDRATGGPPAHNIFDLNGDGRIDIGDADIAAGRGIAGVGFGTRGSAGAGAEFIDRANDVRVIRLPLSNGSPATLTLSYAGFSGRRSWHEIRQ